MSTDHIDRSMAEMYIIHSDPSKFIECLRHYQPQYQELMISMLVNQMAATMPLEVVSKCNVLMEIANFQYQFDITLSIFGWLSQTGMINNGGLYYSINDVYLYCV